ncbi:hypothetical protein PACTADRAFT_4299 [Pachysolen tannophilus NRRL Y-2460]|uniref:Uncharacterized protein n=1 Tax=Pachysolen tannophilus NRRL Y-2460 TaxID=669874 RepID=A0A1E4TRJ9_PACTA|nr:hypothetical protein PACTADRAFT_4299 [Pachysolen tannophilus NRRL Y-2460]
MSGNHHHQQQQQQSAGTETFPALIASLKPTILFLFAFLGVNFMVGYFFVKPEDLMIGGEANNLNFQDPTSFIQAGNIEDQKFIKIVKPEKLCNRILTLTDYDDQGNEKLLNKEVFNVQGWIYNNSIIEPKYLVPRWPINENSSSSYVDVRIYINNESQDFEPQSLIESTPDFELLNITFTKTIEINNLQKFEKIEKINNNNEKLYIHIYITNSGTSIFDTRQENYNPEFGIHLIEEINLKQLQDELKIIIIPSIGNLNNNKILQDYLIKKFQWIKIDELDLRDSLTGSTARYYPIVMIKRQNFFKKIYRFFNENKIENENEKIDLSLQISNNLSSILKTIIF